MANSQMVRYGVLECKGLDFAGQLAAEGQIVLFFPPNVQIKDGKVFSSAVRTDWLVFPGGFVVVSSIDGVPVGHGVIKCTPGEVKEWKTEVHAILETAQQ